MYQTSIIADFKETHNKKWENIFEAIEHTQNIRGKILESLKIYTPLTTSDIDMVVFGSIARNECTSKSDVDWTLLIDGQAGPHYRVADTIKTALSAAKLEEPGTSGMFGNITFSHELVHYIGGQDDTNHNISRRVLLLLEAEKMVINDEDDTGTAFERVIRQIIEEYVSHDSSLVCNIDKTSTVPRFLLNDIIRFWRTICVDFAYKQKGQPEGKWGLRNIKLRLSRKLIYVKGLLMCFSCYLNDKQGKDAVRDHLLEVIKLSPLEILIKVMSNRNVDGLLLQIIDCYDAFLGIINDDTKREHLASLTTNTAYDDVEFLAARKIANDFQEAMNKLFEGDKELKAFTQKYVLF